MLTHLRQRSAVPNRDGDSSQGRGGGKQQPGAQEIPRLRSWWNPAGCLVYGDGFSAKRSQFTKGHGDLGKKLAKMHHGATYFLQARLWLVKGEIGAQKIQESVFKKLKNAFFYEI
jgi:hypothetical protein